MDHMDPREWRWYDWVIYCGWAGGILMWEWLRAMFGRECIHCHGWKPLFTSCCDRCWKIYHRTEDTEY